MGRPKKHDERTAHALLEAAEALVQRDGADGVSVRRVADEVGTSTRAVYSLFDSKDGLLAALVTRAYELLAEGVNQLPITDDAAQDLVNVGAVVFRDFAINHPSMFRIAVQRTAETRKLEEELRPIRMQALDPLRARVERLAQAGLLNGRPVPDAVLQFHALCEGLAALELRGVIQGARIWHDALSALVTGLGSPPSDTSV